MEEEKWYAYWMCGVPGVGNRTIGRLIQVFGSAGAVYRASEKALSRVLNKAQLQSLLNSRRKENAKAEYEKLKEQEIAFYTVEEAAYPGRLKKIPDPPYGLFVKGRLPGEECLSVAVIGARDCSEYGRYVATELGRYLASCGIQVISGMARGIDGISQEAALGTGGASFGVLGCGVDVCYPAQNKRLYEQLLEKGGILSAYLPGTLPKSGHFPPRNRIVSGLADVLVVIEARKQSGTLITVDMALEQGKDVYVVPGRVTDRLSDGCNNLIKQGAGVFLSPEEFVREALESRIRAGGSGRADGRAAQQPQETGNGGKETVSTGISSCEKQLPDHLARIREALDFYPLSAAEIAARLGGCYTASKLNTDLMQLCLEGMAVQISPGHFCRKG